MSDRNKFFLLNTFIALVWLVNGLFCKVLDCVPRHQEIVGRILGNDNANSYTIAIGIGEIFIFCLVLTAYRPKLIAILQIVLVASMNTIEFIMVPDILLWGKLNALFALLFILVVYYSAFHLEPRTSNSPSNELFR